jgi:molybdopterin converting factor small subunit
VHDVTVLVFGPLRERVGVAEVRITGTTVQSVWDELVRLHPAAAVDTGSVRAARNLNYCEWDTLVLDGDTIAFIPPVAGGCADESAVRVRVTDAPIDIGSLIESAGSSGDGAIATWRSRSCNASVRSCMREAGSAQSRSCIAPERCWSARRASL